MGYNDTSIDRKQLLKGAKSSWLKQVTVNEFLFRFPYFPSRLSLLIYFAVSLYIVLGFRDCLSS